MPDPKDPSSLPATEHHPDDRLFAPAVARNLEPIWEVLGPELPLRGLALEIAAGTGEHGVTFAARRRDLKWQAADPDPNALRSAAAWKAHAGLPNYLDPIPLDVTQEPWPVARADAVININMIHISPWACTEALMGGAGKLLAPDGLLFLYGPYKRAGAHTSASNAEFDQSLRARNPDWGIRDLEAVIDEAARHGLRHRATHQMPANNLSVVFRKV